MDAFGGIIIDEVCGVRRFDKVIFLDAGEKPPAGLRPDPRYAQIAACRECEMGVADDDYEFIDAMTEEELSKPGVVIFPTPEVFN